MTEQEMFEAREEERDIETVVEFLKEHCRFYSASKVALLLDRYHALKYKGIKDSKPG